MANDRAELIRDAILNKMGVEISVYSADDILIAAGIPESEIEKLISQLQQNIESLSNAIVNDIATQSDKSQQKAVK